MVQLTAVYHNYVHHIIEGGCMYRAAISPAVHEIVCNLDL